MRGGGVSDRFGVEGWVPVEPDTVPLARTWLFLLGYGLYGAVVTWSTLSIEPTADGTVPLAAAAVTGASLFGLAVAVQRRQSRTDHRTLPWPVVAGSVLVFVVYVGAYVAVTVATRGWTGLAWSTMLVALAQSGILAMVLGVYSRPLVPALAAPGDPGERLDQHLTTWWRFAQLTMSVFFAYGVGLAAGPPVAETALADALPKLAFVAGVGILALAVYALLKLSVVGSEIQRYL